MATASWGPSPESPSPNCAGNSSDLSFCASPQDGAPSSVVHRITIGSVSQRCLQNGLGCLASASVPLLLLEVARPSPVGGRAESSGTCFLWAGPSSSCRWFSLTAASLSLSAAQIGEGSLLAILLLGAGGPGPWRRAGLVPVRSPLGSQASRDHDHRRLLPLRPRPIRCCGRLSPRSPHR